MGKKVNNKLYNIYFKILKYILNITGPGLVRWFVNLMTQTQPDPL